MKSYRLASIGFIVFISMAVLFFGIRFLQNESFQKSTFTFKVVFNDLQGLDISDDVRMLGKKIGRVSGTEIVGQKIAVQVTIDNSFAFKLPIDSDIEITQSDLLKLFFNKSSIISFAVLKFFIFSLVENLYILRLYFFKDLCSFFNIFKGMFLSLIIHILFTPGKFFWINFPVIFIIPFPK